MKTPACPNCRVKFSHDKVTMQCRHCGLPDEVRSQGPRAIARWRRAPYLVVPKNGIYQIEYQCSFNLSKRARKQHARYPGARKQRLLVKCRKHGRQIATR